MKFLTKFINDLSNNDIFGSGINLTYRGQLKYSSFVSKLFTLLFIIYII